MPMQALGRYVVHSLFLHARDLVNAEGLSYDGAPLPRMRPSGVPVPIS